MKSAVIFSTILIVLGGVFGNYLRFSNRMPDAPPSFDKIPYRKSPYYGEEKRFSEESYDVLNADTTTLRLYRTPEGGIYWLFVAYFSSQQYGSQIHSPKHCLPGGGWKIEKQEPFTLRLSDKQAKEINRVIISDDGKKELMFYWFETRSGAIRDEFGLKWDLMKNSLLLRPTDAAFIRLTVSFEHLSIEQATAQAVAFFRTFYPDIEKALPFGN